MAEDSKRILVVDDEPDTRTFLTTVLEDNGYQTQEVADGEEAIRVIEDDPPDLITLDISMPEKSGVSIYRRLKESQEYKSIPVIMVTGVSSEFKRFISTRRQVPPPEGYISKPVDHEEFLRLVGQLLS
jgi:CheY-like chemotaxis protein